MARLLGFALLAPALILIAPSGCAIDDEQEVAAASTTSALQSTRQGSITHTAFALDTTGLCDAPQAAAAAAASPILGLYPDGCATKTLDGTTVHVRLNDCTGPFGRVHLSGGIDATFSAGSECGRFTAQITGGPDLTANGRALAYQGTADIRSDGDKRLVAWSDTASGTTKRGREFTRTSTLSIVADVATNCEDIEGSTHATVASWDVDATITDYRVCEDRCPSSGTLRAVKHGAVADRSMSIVFDGSDDAHVTGWRGRKFDVHLACDDGETE